VGDGEVLQKIQSFVQPDEWTSAQTLVGESASSTTIVQCLVRNGALTNFQAEGINRGAFAGLRIGNYGRSRSTWRRRNGDGLQSPASPNATRGRAESPRPTVLRRSDVRESVFQREVQTLAKLMHPNIVAAYDADEAEVGHFLVMEYVAGADLSSIVARARMTLRIGVRAIADAARGLSYAHKQGIIHRDVKPANLLQDAATGVVKVTDLGLGTAFGSQCREHGITQAGGILGTADYMSPEQAVDSTTLGPSTDIYSLGGTLYFVLTGNAPYPRQHADEDAVASSRRSDPRRQSRPTRSSRSPRRTHPPDAGEETRRSAEFDGRGDQGTRSHRVAVGRRRRERGIRRDVSVQRGTTRIGR